jgi:hypothetical protein
MFEFATGHARPQEVAQAQNFLLGIGRGRLLAIGSESAQQQKQAETKEPCWSDHPVNLESPEDEAKPKSAMNSGAQNRNLTGFLRKIG